jgi:hypothetical protein
MPVTVNALPVGSEPVIGAGPPVTVSRPPARENCTS